MIGVTDQGLLQRFAQANAQAREGGLTRLVESMPLPWDTYRDHVERAVRHIWVSHKPDHGFEGGFLEDTAYSPPMSNQSGMWVTRGINGVKPNQRDAESLTMIPIARYGRGPRALVEPVDKTVFKGYVGGSNYCIEITRNAQGKWEGEVISTFKAYGIVRAGVGRNCAIPRRGRTGNRWSCGW